MWKFYWLYIRVMSHECDGISNHWQLNYLSNSLFRRTAKIALKLCIPGPLHVRGIHWWLMDSPQKWPAIQETYPYVMMSSRPYLSPAGIQRLLASLHLLKSRASGEEGDLSFLKDLLESTDFQSLLKVGVYEYSFNSLAPGRPGCHFKTAIFNLVLLMNAMGPHRW